MPDRPNPERISRSANKSAYLFKRQQPLQVYFLSLRIRPRKESLQGRKGGGFEAETRAEEPPSESKDERQLYRIVNSKPRNNLPDRLVLNP